VEEREFLTLADAELDRLDTALEYVQAGGVADFDFEKKPGGIIEIEFEDGSKIIVNRHAAAREIWVAARSGGFHFTPPKEMGGRWSGTRGGEDLAALLSLCISEQVGVTVQLEW
jgi:CyaY protein